MLRPLTYAGIWLALGLASVPAAAAEICHQEDQQQYTDSIRTCVSSELAPQRLNTYGPDKLVGENDGSKGAWCEGVAGPGIGETITLHQTPSNVIDSMSFVNGYIKTPQLYKANGRVKQARIETSGGYKKTIQLADTSEFQFINISPHAVSWVRLVILAVYPGTRGNDTCVTTFYLNQE